MVMPSLIFSSPCTGYFGNVVCGARSCEAILVEECSGCSNSNGRCLDQFAYRLLEVLCVVGEREARTFSDRDGFLNCEGSGRGSCAVMARRFPKLCFAILIWGRPFG